MEFQSFTLGELQVLEDGGELFAAGYFSGDDIMPAKRIVNGLKNLLLKASLPAYNGELLYPCGSSTFYPRASLSFHYVRLFTDVACAEKKREQSPGEDKHVWEKLIDNIKMILQPGGYTHCCINYERFLSGGLPGLSDRIVSARTRHSESKEKLTMLDNEQMMLEILVLHINRIIGYLKSLVFTGEEENNRISLIKTFKKLLEGGVSGFDEAVRAVNLLMYWDGVDSLGRFDKYMYPYYIHSQPEKEYALKLVRCLWRNIDYGGGLNVTLGGSDKNGNSTYSELTKICIEASRGMRRPNLSLRCRHDMPDDVWETALDCISSGTGNPALYSEQTYQQGLQRAHLDISHEDINDFCFGGCTETMLQGTSNVGSLDHDLNHLAVLERTIHEKLISCNTFDNFTREYKNDLRQAIRSIVESVNESQRCKALYHAQPIRSLFVDDCIEAGIDFTDGGARYNWSVINCMGISNTADSLYNIKHFVFEEQKITKTGLIKILSNNYSGYESIRQMFLNTPKYGNSNTVVDKLASDLTSFIYNELLLYAPYRGGRFLPSCIMFVTYADFGKQVGATPDGRYAYSPLGDSIGPMQGQDKAGPTAVLSSALQINQLAAIGTLVMNLRISKSTINTRSSRAKLRHMTEAYFKNGGQQIQYNVLDQEALKEAYKHPGTSPNLIVRMGGFSEYFDNLSNDLKLAVIERVEHSF